MHPERAKYGPISLVTITLRPREDLDHVDPNILSNNCISREIKGKESSFTLEFEKNLNLRRSPHQSVSLALFSENPTDLRAISGQCREPEKIIIPGLRQLFYIYVRPPIHVGLIHVGLRHGSDAPGNCSLLQHITKPKCVRFFALS